MLLFSNLSKVKKLALMALFLAVCISLSYIEYSLPPIPFFPPGARLGLSNVIVMYTLIFISGKEAFTLAVLKALFVFFTRGAAAGFLSITGGIFSVFVMCLLMVFFKKKASYVLLSVLGAVFHNIGQFVAFSIILGGFSLLFYLPVLVILGVFAGIATATVLRFLLPALQGCLRGGD